MTITIISLVIATLIPLVALYIIYTRDLYSTGAAQFIAISFVWGGLAFALASTTNRFLLDTAGVDYMVLVRFIAPLEEEILKGILLLFLVRRKKFTYFVDGAIYGFAIGIGFAVIENYQYLLSSEQSVQLTVAVVRVISTNLMHATGSSIIGIAVGLARFSRGTRRSLYAAAGLVLSGGLHVFFNLVSNSTFNNTLVLIGTITVIGVIGFGVIILAIRQGIKQSRNWIEEKLGMADRVTAGETQAVLSLKKIDEILEPLVQQFGEDKAEHIETLLKKQARLGILRKSLDKLQEQTLIEATKHEMAEVRADMEEARKEIGAYAMLCLRGIFPETDRPLWGQLETVLLAAPAAQPGGMWDKLDQQVNPRSENNKPVE